MLLGEARGRNCGRGQFRPRAHSGPTPGGRAVPRYRPRLVPAERRSSQARTTRAAIAFSPALP